MLIDPNDSLLRRRGKAAAVLAFLGIGVILYFARDAFVPVAIGLFLAVLLSPIVDFLQRIRLPRSIAVGLVMLALLSIGVGGVNAVWTPAKAWIAQAPQTLRVLDTRIRPLRNSLAKVEALTRRAGTLAQAQPPAGKAATPATSVVAPDTSSALGFTASFIEALTVIPLTFFFLLGGPPLLARMGASLSGSENTAKALRLTEAIGTEVGRYFATIALINIGLGAATGIAAAALGMPNAILWGTLAGVLNFIPYVGPILTIAVLAIAALVSFTDLSHALAVPGAFLVLHLIESQIVEPLTIGHRLEVNALVILLAIWFGFWFWGIAGVLLAVPTVVALKVVAEHEPSWQVVNNFLAPNERWRPRSIQRMRQAAAARKARAAAAIAPDAIGAERSDVTSDVPRSS